MGSVHPVVVVGAGISGIACARALTEAGVPVRVLDRGRRLGGRMAVRTVEGRPIDIGASYFTVHDDDFRRVVEGWLADGLAHPWTDTFHVATPDGAPVPTVGPMRYGAADGLRSLVEHLADGLQVGSATEVAEVAASGSGPTVDGEPAAAVVLAMPGPQALDLLAEDLVDERAAADGEWEPTLALYAAWERRTWGPVDGVFVNESPLLSWIADDGRRRGDDAAVLVAHSTSVLAAAYLDDPDRAVSPMLRELQTVLDIAHEPRWAAVHRWSLSRPHTARPHASTDAPFHLGERLVGLCGDAWSPRPRVEAAYLSGHLLGQALVDRLAPRATPASGRLRSV